MMEFINTHWTSIIVVLAFITLIVVLALQGKKKTIYKMIYTLVTEAEKKYGSGMGSVKFAEVMTKIYTMLPAVVKVFITYDTLAEWIEKALADAKQHWAEQGDVDQ